MADILKPYTLSQVTIHIRQEFSIRLQKPSDTRVEKAKEEFHFEEAALDKDGDFLATAGEIPGAPEIKIRAAVLYSSQNRLSVDVLGGDTRQAFQVMTSLLLRLYGLSELDLSSGTEYIEYKTVTKVKLKSNLDGIFSEKMLGLINTWRRFDTGSIVSQFNDGILDAAHGAITISKDYYERLFKGQEDIFVVPTDLSFSIFVPTKYYKMTHYKVTLSVRSFEDYSDRLFFLTTELPYDDHVKMVEQIEAMG